MLQHHPHLADKPIAYDLVSKLHGCRCVRIHVDNIAPTEIQAAPTVGASGWLLCLLLLESCLLRLRILLWGLSSRLSRERPWLLEAILWSWLRWVSTPLLLLRWVRTPLLLVIRITCWWRPKGVGRQPLASHGACNKSNVDPTRTLPDVVTAGQQRNVQCRQQPLHLTFLFTFWRCIRNQP